MDVLCLLPLDFLYLKFGVNSLLRLPRCLKVGFPSKAFSPSVLCAGTDILMSALSGTREGAGDRGRKPGWSEGR